VNVCSTKDFNFSELGKYVLKSHLYNWDLAYMIPKGISQTSIPNIYFRKGNTNSRVFLCSSNLEIWIFYKKLFAVQKPKKTFFCGPLCSDQEFTGSWVVCAREINLLFMEYLQKKNCSASVQKGSIKFRHHHRIQISPTGAEWAGTGRTTGVGGTDGNCLQHKIMLKNDERSPHSPLVLNRT